MKEAMYYEKLKDGMVYCKLCPQGCRIKNGKYGICRARKNQNGILVSDNYGKVTGIAMDPIEKKPLYHFYPGSYILSIGSFGCNLSCAFCQNWHISQQRDVEYRLIRPEELINIAEKQRGNIGIAYTYNEPSIWYEYMYDCAKIAKDRGLKNIMVTNGYINPEPLYNVLPYIDALNIDVKAFSDHYYKTLCGGRLASVINTVEIASRLCHVELTTLIVTDENDNLGEIEELVKWVASIDKDIPLHFTRYFPNYKMKNPPTEINTLLNTYKIGKKYLNYVYIGNVGGIDNNTYCPNCGNLLIKRDIYVDIVGVGQDKKCSRCGKEIKVQF